MNFDGLARAGVTGITIDLTLPSFVADLAAHWAGPAPRAGLAAVEALLDAKDAAGLAAAGAEIYAPLIAAAEVVAGIVRHTGRTAPDVVT